MSKDVEKYVTYINRYVISQFQSERDPRQRHVQRPSRLKDVIKLYFQNFEAMLPQICPLDFLASTLVEFCRQNDAHISDKDITQQDQAKFNEALKQLATMERNRMEEVRLSNLFTFIFQFISNYLTLFQSEGADYAYHIILSLFLFNIFKFRRPYFKISRV